MAILSILATLAIGLVAGFIGAIVGGGGLVSIPLLMVTGLSPVVAIATNRFAAIGFSIGGIIRYAKSKKIVWKHVLPLSISGVTGAIVGANILLQIDERFVKYIVTAIILVVLLFVLVKKKLGIEERPKVGRRNAVLAYILYFAVGVYGGFFGGGAFLFVIILLVSLLGLTYIKASATDLVPWLFLSISATIVYALAGKIDYLVGIALFVGMTIGAYLGAHTAIKKGNVWVRYVYIIVILASVVKLMFF